MKYGEDARTVIAVGMLSITSLIEATYGPRGGNVVFQRVGGGVTATSCASVIMEDMKLTNPYMDEGVQLVRQAMKNVGDQAGDGATLTALLIKRMVKEGMKYLAAGANPVMMRRGLKQSLEYVENELKKYSIPIKEKQELIRVIESFGLEDSMAQLVFEAYDTVANQGIVLVKSSSGTSSYLKFEDGMQLKSGYISAGFCEKEEKTITFHNPYILVADTKITSFSSLLPLLEQVVKSKAPLLLIAEDVQGEALSMLLHNKKKQIFQVVAVQAEGYKARKKDILQDIATFTGTKVISREKGDCIEKVSLTMLGRAKEVKVSKDTTTILGGRGVAWEVENRIREIQKQIDDDRTVEYDKNQFRERIGRLNTKIAIISVGSYSTIQAEEEKIQVESAVKTARRALTQGIVPGGGSCLFYIANHWVNQSNDVEESFGEFMLKQALMEPIACLMKSYGEAKGIEIVGLLEEMKVEDRVLGFDLRTGKITDMKEVGIMDAFSVILTALEQAVSTIYEWLCIGGAMISIGPDREDLALMKEGVPLMW